LAKDHKDLELKFDGDPIKRLDGAPVSAVVSSLNAIQRMVHIIGMRAEGRGISERIKPTIRVKREYAVVCRAAVKGSHIQPFAVESMANGETSDSIAASERLIETLKALDSGDENRLVEAVPNDRERWFLANSAAGLLPDENSGIDVMVRAGNRGPFAFRAERARDFIEDFQVRPPPSLGYPLPLEEWLQANVRKRLQITGRPKFNKRGDISTFQPIETITETEPHLEPIDRFKSNGRLLATNRPVTLPITVFWEDRLFSVRDPQLGIDVVTQGMNELRDAVLSELDFLWRHYAAANDRELDQEALAVAIALRSRFGAIDR
jgi:hypothetical protein